MLDHRQEIITFMASFPVKIFIHKLGEVPRHWHSSLELLLVLEGEIEISIENQIWQLKSEDILLVNSSTMHALKSAGAVMIAVQINPEKFNMSGDDARTLYFDCNSVKGSNEIGFNALKTIIARMIKQGDFSDKAAGFYEMALAYNLFATLLDHFSAIKANGTAGNGKQVERINRILAYINANFDKGLTLQQVAQTEGLSSPYFSMLFENETGVNFSTYYSTIRLEHAVNDLLETSDTIEKIALRNGYSESHSFIRAFKRHYGLPPSIYRKDQADLMQMGNSKGGINYLALEPGNHLQVLTKHLKNPLADVPAISPVERLQICKPVDTRIRGRQFGQAFGKFIGVGSALELLFKDVQVMLADLQREIGFEYVKFHGLLGDEMMVCNRREGKLHFSFLMIDKAIDFLLSIGLKPLIQLSFMPDCLAENAEKRVLYDRFNTSAPKEIEEWNDLIRATTEHLLDRYGSQKVHQWLFAFWNEPDLAETMFSIGNDEQFRLLYANTYRTIKSVDEKLIIGAPSNMPVSPVTRDWMEQFLQWSVENECRPQFLNIHYYSEDFEQDNDQKYLIAQRRYKIMKRDPDNMGKYIENVHSIRARSGMSDLPIYLTEFNLTVSHRSLINDTCFISAWLVRNLMMSENKLDSFGYWSLTDFICEQQHASPLFHGGLGMYTVNGIRKPAFYAYKYARQMSGALVAQGENFSIVWGSGMLRILCWNYEHFNDLFASGETFDMTATDRYTPFNRQQPILFRLPLQHLPGGNYTIREYFVNRDHGSAFDQWVKSGAQPLETPEEIELLRQASQPGFRKSSRFVDDGTLEYETVIEPHEIRLVEIAWTR